ncbi:MAG: hypothetical protein IPH28_25040 [Cytophagaceae bacterium]|nr:hypothetical protein [Cytophagaceae bacterium]MBL0304116.1 hypothetical protein [Cytophagaceae bacterium]MBL0326926.1 hypothetical protein [Cytophagaceae bacterium]
MKRIFFLLIFINQIVFAQKVILEKGNLIANQVYMSFEKIEGKNALRVEKDSTLIPVDEPTFVKIKDLDFKDGEIEVKVLSRLLKNASPTARGFIGIAFRIDEKNEHFESIYIRPTNGRADDQVRRNHAIQYFSYPDYKFDKLRKISPEKYESYADMGLNEWIIMKVVVKGNKASLFLNNNTQPALIVNDLKLGDQARGGIGLWVEVGTEGFFRDLSVKHF